MEIYDSSEDDKQPSLFLKLIKRKKKKIFQDCQQLVTIVILLNYILEVEAVKPFFLLTVGKHKRECFSLKSLSNPV